MTNYRVKSDTIPSRKERKETPSCGQSKGETKAKVYNCVNRSRWLLVQKCHLRDKMQETLENLPWEDHWNSFQKDFQT